MAGFGGRLDRLIRIKENDSCLRYATVHERGFSADCSGGFGSATGVLSFPAGCWQDGFKENTI